ncbi:MAG: 50S ribosomal protein L29 [Balneolaceae bacterium]
MKAHELRDLSMTELEARLEDEKKIIDDLVFNKAVAGQLENPNRIKMTRREIARIKTIINEKTSAEQ